MRQQQKRKAALFEALEGRTHFSTTITGFVHNDVNGDRILDESSTTPATRVYLDLNGNGKRDSWETSVLTDQFGQYKFNNMPAGTYQVRFDLPAGWAASNTTARVGASLTISGSNKESWTPMAMIRYGSAPWSTVGQNAQHTGISPFRGGPLTGTPQEVTSESVEVPDTGVKFGTPVFAISRLNTVLVPVYNGATDKFEVRAYSRAFGALMWRFVSDFEPPPSVSLSLRTATAVFQPAVGADGKIYVPGAGGSVWVLTAPDSFGEGATDRLRTGRRVMFYGKGQFVDKPGRFRSSLFINTPLTVGPNGDVFFGVEAKKNNPLGTESALARVRADGTGSWVETPVAAGAAPTLSNDGAFVYVVSQTAGGKAQLERYRAGGAMAAAGSQVLKDPANRKKLHLTPGSVAVPVVAPDGDVYLAAPARKKSVADAGNGWLLRFPADLSKAKGTSAQVMSDATPSIVPTSMTPWYRGTSSYLVVAARFTSQDENKSGTDVQRLSLLDPAKSLKRTGGEFLLPLFQDDNQQYTLGFVSAPVTVDPSSGAIYLVDAAERLLRWNLADVTNITAPLPLGSQLENQGGSPVVIGPDGEVYAAVGGKLYATF